LANQQKRQANKIIKKQIRQLDKQQHISKAALGTVDVPAA
jgi:hypothetical protein